MRSGSTRWLVSFVDVVVDVSVDLDGDGDGDVAVVGFSGRAS